MDTELTIASKRDERRYADRPLAPEDVEAILDAGRLTGSARNRQPWIFCVVEAPEARMGVARAVYVQSAVMEAPLVVGLVVTPGGGVVDFDAGRAAQNMMLAAWSRGIVSCPHGIAHRDALHDALGLGRQERAVVVLTFGHPGLPRSPERRTTGEWSRRARRYSLEELTRTI